MSTSQKFDQSSRKSSRFSARTDDINTEDIENLSDSDDDIYEELGTSDEEQTTQEE